jgi:hypothetical protein
MVAEASGETREERRERRDESGERSVGVRMRLCLRVD